MKTLEKQIKFYEKHPLPKISWNMKKNILFSYMILFNWI